MGIEIEKITDIKIEYAPKPAKKYLNDKTSFDAYITYLKSNQSHGFLGIEVKYTEQGYKLKPDSKQAAEIQNPESLYYKTSDAYGIYKASSTDLLKTDTFRQIWRNQLLGQKILMVDDTFDEFTSITLFPVGNTHFVKTAKEYMELLVANDRQFIPLTFERLFSVRQYPKIN